MILKTKSHFIPLMLLIGFLSFWQTRAQNNVFEAYDNIVSLENTGLYNGTEFKDLYLYTDGSYRYFELFNFTEGSIVYNKQYYSKVFFKYDLLEDLVITSSDDNLSIFSVKLIPENISSFSIYGHDFVRLPDTNLSEVGNGFFEEAYQGDSFSLYIKHRKRMKDKIVNNVVQYRFTENNFYVFQYKNEYHSIFSIKDLKKNFPEYKEQINTFYKIHKQLYKKDNSTFMIRLTEHLDRLKTTSN